MTSNIGFVGPVLIGPTIPSVSADAENAIVIIAFYAVVYSLYLITTVLIHWLNKRKE
jgi:hypothetical protein